MTPIHTPLDIRNHSCGDRIISRDNIRRSHIFHNIKHLMFCQFGASVFCAQRHLALPPVILNVLGARPIFKILLPIVSFYSVAVTNLLTRWDWANKGGCYKPMDIVPALGTLFGQFYAQIVSGMQAWRNYLCRDCPKGFGRVPYASLQRANAATRANLVQSFIARDGFPNLIGIIGVSHSELILRIGQGRAALTRCFRPDFYSRFLLERKAA